MRSTPSRPSLLRTLSKTIGGLASFGTGRDENSDPAPRVRRVAVPPPAMPRLRPVPPQAIPEKRSHRAPLFAYHGNAVLKLNWPAPMSDNLFRDDFIG